MSSQPNSTLLGYLRGIVHDPKLDGLTDKELLRLFNTERREDAFAAIVRNHGPAILSLCRRHRENAADAEDLFQAVFLILARKAASIKNDSAFSWLFSTAFRMSNKESQKEARKKKREQRIREKKKQETEVRQMSPERDPAVKAELKELQKVVDEVVASLPKDLQEVIFLSYYESKTDRDIAVRIRMAESTVRWRRKRGLDLLKEKLKRRGIAPSAALLATALSQQTSTATVTASMVGSISRAATAFALGRQEDIHLLTKAAALAEELLRSSTMRKWIWVALLALATGGTAGGIGYSVHMLAPNSKPAEAIESEPLIPPPDLQHDRQQKAAQEDPAEMKRKLDAIIPAIVRAVEQIFKDSRAERVSAVMVGGDAEVVLKWRVMPAVGIFSPVFDLKIRYAMTRRELSLYYRRADAITWIAKTPPAWTAKNPNQPIWSGPSAEKPTFILGHKEFQIVKAAFESLHD